MAYFTLQLISNESSFEYSFPQEFLDKNYEIALIKLDGNLEVNKKININYANDKFWPYFTIDIFFFHTLVPLIFLKIKFDNNLNVYPNEINTYNTATN